MGLKTTRKMPSFEGVTTGSTATLRMPIGRTYEQLIIEMGVAVTADIDEIRIVANGQVIHRYSGAELDIMNGFEKRTASGDAILIVDFNRHGLRTRAGEEFTKIGTGLDGIVSTLSCEVDLAAGIVGTPTLTARAVQSAPSALGAILKLRKFQYTAGAAGDFEISDLPKGDLINKIYFAKAGINTVKIERDNFVVFERPAATNTRIQTDGERTPQTNYYVYDPTEAGNGAEGMVTQNVKDLRFILDLAASGGLTVIVEYVGGLDR